MKALRLQGADLRDNWYKGTSGFDGSADTAVIFTQVGKGRLGYIGDVNAEEESDKVILTMLGLCDSGILCSWTLDSGGTQWITVYLIRRTNTLIEQYIELFKRWWSIYLHTRGPQNKTPEPSIP